jgi:tetratricopeptide (TPR) repeat protein
VSLARAAIELGRNSADPRYYGQAEAALVPWWTDGQAPNDVKLLRATIRQAFHQFDLALADVDAVIAADPGNAQARFSRAFIHLTRGEPTEAAKDCAALEGPQLKLIAAICMARADALTGKGEEAAKGLILVLAEERRANIAMKKFALTVLADIKTGLGDWATTTRYYQQVIAAGNADVATVAAYADILLALNKPKDALELLEDQGSADIVILRQAIAAKRSGDRRFGQWQAILADRFAANQSSGNRVHLREEARYLLDVLDEAGAALPLALENFTVQKEPADAELLLRAAIAMKDAKAAQPVLDHVKATGLKDQRLEPLIAKLSVMEPAT